MAHKFAEIAFTETVRKVQEEMGSREGYRSMDGGPEFNNLFSENEADFISARDSFYLATVGETGWPYVQHRGGPAGFVKVLDAQTIGFSDYAGNRQYVSTGNLRTDNRVSLFFMDYPNRRRLKILGRVSPVDSSDLETLAQLEDDHFRAPVERAFLIHVEAFDWNCPKYITPRYTDEDVEKIIAPLQQKLEQLQSTTVSPKAILTPVTETNPAAPEIIGNGPLALVIAAVRQEATNIRSYELRHPEGHPLPPVKAGSHIQVPILTVDGETIWRFYSICSDPDQQSHYQIAVFDHGDGSSGSHRLHQHYRVGMQLACYRPGNYFSMQDSRHEKGGKAVFIAGGIGITPVQAMVKSALTSGYDFDLHYAVRNRGNAAFLGALSDSVSNLQLYPSDEGFRLNLADIFRNAEPDTIHYLCGPPSMLTAARTLAEQMGMPKHALIFETFEE